MISDSLAELLIQSIPGLLIPGLTVTIPLTLVSFGLGLILALFTALVQIARVPVLRQIARFYVWIIRGTPLLVQLYIIFYGLPSLNIKIDAIPSAIIARYLRTPPGGDPFRSPGTAGSRLLCGDDLFPDHAADHHPSSF